MAMVLTGRDRSAAYGHISWSSEVSQSPSSSSSSWHRKLVSLGPHATALNGTRQGAMKLIIAMPTVRRPNNERYLHDSISSILAEVSGQRALAAFDSAIVVHHPRGHHGDMDSSRHCHPHNEDDHLAFQELFCDDAIINQWRNRYFAPEIVTSVSPRVTLDLYEKDNWNNEIGGLTACGGAQCTLVTCSRIWTLSLS